MGRNNNNSTILWMLTILVVLTPVCGMLKSSPLPAQTPLRCASYQAEATASLLTETRTVEPKGSVSLSDDASKTFELVKTLPPTDKPSNLPDIRFWYGQYFSGQNLRILKANPFETEPSRLGLKISFAF